MAKFNTDTLSLFHTFSKTQVNSDANKPQFSSLGNTVNKSGHTVQSNEIWTEAIPFFGLGVPADFSSTAQVNDLVKDADGVIWQRNATPYNDANGTYWTQKTKSITSFTKGTDGKYTFTEEDGALVDGSYLLNAAGVPTVKYHAKKQLTPLVSDNNAFIDSEKDASRLKIDGKWVDQFIGVTDVYVNGSAAVSYAPVLFSNSSSTTPLKAGAGEDYLDYCATGIILWDKSECTGNEVISCFEYVGAKLDTSLSDIRKDVQDIIGTTMEGVVASVTASDAAKSAGIDVDSSTKTSPKITLTTGSVAAGVTKLVTGDAVNTAIKNAIDAIPEVPAATTDTAGIVTISTSNAIAIDATSTAAATVAAIAATRSEIAEEMGALSLTVTAAQGDAQEAAASAAASASAAEAAKSEAAAAKTAAQSASSAAGQAASASSGAASAASSAASAANSAKSAASASATSASQSASAAAASQSAAEAAASNASASAQSATQAAADAKAAKDFVEALTIPEISTVNSGNQLDINDHVIEVKTSTFTAQTDTNSTSIGTMTANENGLATGATVVAVANDALRAAKAYSQSLHTTSVTYHVTDTLPTVPAGEEEKYKGRIYLVLTGIDGVTAADGDRIEYMYVQENDVWGWEQIGTTTADLADYAKTADLNATNVGSGAVKVSQTNGKVSSVTVATEALVDNNAIKESTTSDTALVTAKDALAAIKLAKPENYVASVTVGSITTSGETTLTINDGRTTVYPNDLWGTTISMVDKTITVQSEPIDGTAWSAKNGHNTAGTISINGKSYPLGSNPITKVENNIVYNGTTEIANIKTNEIVNGTSMFQYTVLTSFNSDLSSLVNGTDMFRSTFIPSYSGDLSNLVNGYNMFYYNGSFTSFSGDLSSLVNGSQMFYKTALASFSGDLSSLVNGYKMFDGTSLESFSGDLSSLVNGSLMFSGTPLASFSGDLSSLVNGESMFCDTSIDSFSGDLSSLVNGYNMFAYNDSLTSFNGDLSKVIDGSRMFYYTSLASFSGDLSSLVNGTNMFSKTSLESFSGDLSSLVNGYQMFYKTSLKSFSGDLGSLVSGDQMFAETSLESFSGDLSSLVNGSQMFRDISLDVESIELICDVLPNYNTENRGKKLQTAKWNSSGTNKGKYTYEDWTSGNYYYPIIHIEGNYKTLSAGNSDGIDRYFSTETINASNVKSIRISWKNISVLSEADRTAITKLFTDTASEKGWTFLTNTELGGTVSPNAVMAADGTIQYHVLAKKDEATEDTATHIDANGKLWTFDTAEAIIGPNIKYWSMFATVEDALTEWELTPWTKPAEEETKA